MQARNPETFSSQSGAQPRTRQAIRVVYERYKAGSILQVEGQGRKEALPVEVQETIKVAFKLLSTISTQAVLWTCTLLHPIAVGVLMAAGFGDVLSNEVCLRAFL